MTACMNCRRSLQYVRLKNTPGFAYGRIFFAIGATGLHSLHH